MPDDDRITALPDLDLRVLDDGEARVEIAVGAGGRLAALEVGPTPLLAPRPSDATPRSFGWGSFPMAPWAGRIRHGRFRFLGEDIALELNHQDGEGDDPARHHSMHGTVLHRPWTVTASTPDSLSMECPLGGALGWPFGGIAQQRITLGPGHVECVLSITADELAFPGDIGWHPWFPKPAELRFSPAAMYRRDDVIGVATGELIVPTVPPWDDCFVASGSATLVYDRPQVPEVTVSSDCDHWVIYDEPVATMCVEPQSGPPDSPTIRPRLITPDRPLSRTMTITWRPGAG